MKATGYNSRVSWMAIAAISVIIFLITLPMRLLGFFFVIILDTYHVDRQHALIPIVTYGTIRTLLGPLVGYLGQIFGLRAIILTGCILASLGMGLSCFTEDIITLTICLGFIYGTGFSFANNLLASVIRQHFTEYLSLTTGILITASSLGSTVMTPVIYYLNNSYGTSGMFLVLSGIFLHMIPAAMFIRNPKNEKYDSQKNQTKNHFINNNQNLKQISCEKSNVFLKEEKRNYEEEHSICADLKKTEQDEYSEIITESFKRSLTSVKDYDKTNVRKSVEKHRDTQDSKCSLKITKSKTLCNSISIFYNPPFLTQMILQSLHAFGYTMILSVLIDYARDKQISTEDALFFITFIPIAQIFGSLGFNWITDSKYMSRINFCMICFCILALDIEFLIWSHNFNLLIIGYLVYGFVNGALLSIFPGMIMDNIEKEYQNMALASRFVLYGLLCPLKSPIVGYFRGYLKSYEGLYYLILGLYILCGLLAKLTQILQSCNSKKGLIKNVEKSSLVH